MNRFKRYGKIIIFDTLALICFAGAILLSPVPGPGGIPLFIAGLALLAANHDWAERWLETAKHKSGNLKKYLFPDVQWIRHIYDILSVTIFSGASYLFFTTDNRLIAGASIAAASFSLFVFLLNRDRFGKFATLFKKNKA